ncbi:hypothetical protein B0A55_01400 [Friedmanniomyces simplex]|uniref:Histone H4 n=1 Tax=Friedmanniomyces simplex TaxID=329884 RepID=A0A4U0XZE9_9PEZI|nr:hypothetical protein B0A55_01400 [Friedmanniomyces simplex]
MARLGVANLLRSDVSGSRNFPSTGGKVKQSIGGKSAKGLGLGLGGRGETAKRHRKILRDNVQGVTKGDIRRLARRGGVKRISGMIYEETRSVLKQFLERVLKDTCAIVENCGRKTVTTPDVGFGTPEKGGYMQKYTH